MSRDITTLLTVTEGIRDKLPPGAGISNEEIKRLIEQEVSASMSSAIEAAIQTHVSEYWHKKICDPEAWKKSEFIEHEVGVFIPYILGAQAIWTHIRKTVGFDALDVPSIRKFVSDSFALDEGQAENLIAIAMSYIKKESLEQPNPPLKKL